VRATSIDPSQPSLSPAVGAGACGGAACARRAGVRRHIRAAIYLVAVGLGWGEVVMDRWREREW
jgi:hypothetical protein